MMYTTYLYDLSSKVNSLALQTYLLQKGWKRKNTKRKDVAIITSPNDEAVYDILLPLNRNFVDYADALYGAIKKVAKFEDRDEIQIANDLIAPPADIVRYRVESESTSNGLIPLKAGFELLESAKKSLLSAASDILSPALFHKRMSYKKAVQFIDACYLGQTERGSYIASIVCPFIKLNDEDIPSQMSLFSGEAALSGSITRDVTKKLMTSISIVKEVIESGDHATLEKAEGNNIISVNFLESLIEINEFSQGSIIEISTTWAPTIPIPQDVPTKIQLTNDYIEPIKSIIDKLKPEIVEIKGDYVGKISAIEANPDIKTRQDGVVTFVFINNDEKAITARVTLVGDDVHRAMQAFDHGKNVRITGNLKVSSRQRIIESPVFNIID